MKTRPKATIAFLLWLWALPAVVQAQFNYTTNYGTITITRCTGPGGAVAIPAIITGLPVTSIGNSAFSYFTSLTSVTIPASVTNIGDDVFFGCSSLTAVTVETNNPAYSSVDGILFNKNQTALLQYPASKTGSQYTIPNSVANIGNSAFFICASLASITIPSSVTGIGDYAFADNFGLISVYFQGNAPSFRYYTFWETTGVTLYYLPGTTGWPLYIQPVFGYIGHPTALWFLPNPLILNNGPSFGVQTNGFGFIISWATNLPVVVEASTSLVNPTWTPVWVPWGHGRLCW